MNKMVNSVVLLLLAMASLALGQFNGQGGCPTPRASANLDPMRYQGNWYVVAEVRNDVGEPDMRCSRWNYLHDQQGNDHLSFTSILDMSGALMDFTVDARVYGGNASPHFDITYPKYAQMRHANVTVLDTDYDHYAVQWSCQSYGDRNHQWVWILSRTPVLDNVYEMRAENLIRQSVEIPSDELERVDQNNCPGR